MIQEKKDGNSVYRTPAVPKRNKSVSFFIDGATIAAIVALFVVIFMIYIVKTEITAEISLVKLGLEGALVSVCTIGIYALTRSFSRRRGKLTDAYLGALKSVQEADKEIRDRGFAKFIKEYCHEWEDEELDEMRSILLKGAGVSLEEFKEKYLIYSKSEIREKYKGLSKRQINIIAKAIKMKRLRYDPDYLTPKMRNGHRHSPSGGLNSHDFDIIYNVRTCITTTVVSVCGAAITVDTFLNLSWATVTSFVIKVATIFIFAVVGMSSGYRMSTEVEVCELNDKAAAQQEFQNWCVVRFSKLIKENDGE